MVTASSEMRNIWCGGCTHHPAAGPDAQESCLGSCAKFFDARRRLHFLLEPHSLDPCYEAAVLLRARNVEKKSGGPVLPWPTVLQALSVRSSSFLLHDWLFRFEESQSTRCARPVSAPLLFPIEFTRVALGSGGHGLSQRPIDWHTYNTAPRCGSEPSVKSPEGQTRHIAPNADKTRHSPTSPCLSRRTASGYSARAIAVVSRGSAPSASGARGTPALLTSPTRHTHMSTLLAQEGD